MTKRQLKEGAALVVLALLSGTLFYVTLVSGVYRPLVFWLDHETVPGTVVSSTVEHHAGGTPKTDRYVPVIEYRYSYEGRTFTNDELTPRWDDKYESESGAGAIADRYPAGEETSVHVRPDDPVASVLFMVFPRGWTLFGCVVGGLLTLAFLAGLVKVIQGEKVFRTEDEVVTAGG